jgi:hypothetical protein
VGLGAAWLGASKPGHVVGWQLEIDRAVGHGNYGLERLWASKGSARSPPSPCISSSSDVAGGMQLRDASWKIARPCVMLSGIHGNCLRLNLGRTAEWVERMASKVVAGG